jgi:tetraacyldisaccharide 4'-kinase
MAERRSEPPNSRPRPPQKRIDERLATRGGSVELLRVPAAMFGAAATLRAALYDRGWLRSERLDAPVVSIGNLSAGGTGKTPMVAWVVRELQRRGLRPGLLSRGYGAKAGELNDEALLLAELLPGVPHVQDADRARGGRALCELQVDVVVLDDGFQHRRLARDLDIVLIDALRPWGLPRESDSSEPLAAFLPRGLLRERPSALSRAHCVVLTRVDQARQSDLVELRGEIARAAPGVALAAATHRAARLRGLDGREVELGELRGRGVDLASGIGNPQAFEASVRGLGATIGEHRQFDDHHAYSESDLDGLARDGRWLVTTAKDAVKLRRLELTARGAVLALEIELEIVSGANVLEALLDALPESRAGRERSTLHEGLHG